MKVSIIGVGRPKGRVGDAIADYEARAARYWKLDCASVDSGGPGARAEPEAVREAEGARILSRLPDAGVVLALTRKGKPLASIWLARFLEEQAVRSTRAVTFVIGGAFGLSASVLQAADRRVSLSSLTLPHDLARLLLTEQLYRAGTILRNEPYHKGTGT